ncbi:MAG TPA: family 16 glycosylhydrolase, partial [Cellvibrionaceae bacterium]|nr:family 16 glycosylhydrolase [Cellvibrionaceae bacterium]
MLTTTKKWLGASLAALCLTTGVAETALAKPYKSAEIFTPAANLYGKYVVRMRAAKASGMISNFFLWKDGSEMSGVFWEEVDVEVFG